jgi:hypothetical protein
MCRIPLWAILWRTAELFVVRSYSPFVPIVKVVRPQARWERGGALPV